MTHLTTIFLAVSLAAINVGVTQNIVPKTDVINDGIDRTDPNFVTASLLVMSPGDELYSSMGHSCFRMECPKFNLDYCFSYESESSEGRMLSLLSGKLKMGMFAVRTVDYLKEYGESGRSIMQYRLNLPPEAKQRLWKYLEEKAAEGINLPYDCLTRGCAQSMLVALREALKPHRLEAGVWQDKYEGTRREIVEEFVMDRPWTRLLLHTFSGMELDRAVAKHEKVVLPEDLVRFLQSAKVGGRRIITEAGIELKPKSSGRVENALISPLIVSASALAMSCVNIFLKLSWFDILFLVFQSVFGATLSYLVFVSDFFGTDWNWLLVPFNILPLLFWKWRKKWALYFAGALVLWEIGMIAWPYRLTDPAYLVLVGAYIVMYARIGRDALVASAKPTTPSRSCADIFDEFRRRNGSDVLAGRPWQR